MLEHVPSWLGQALSGMRAGHDKLVVSDRAMRIGDARIALSSPAFEDGAHLPARFTADGEGVSPPLSWSGVPTEASSLVLIVEDADAPTPSPLVHALVWAMPSTDTGLAEGAIAAGHGDGSDDPDIGRNSYLSKGWLPPDPPTGHGVHDYVFQLFALGDTPDLSAAPGRAEVVKALAGRVVATGVLVGRYSRDGRAG